MAIVLFDNSDRRDLFPLSLTKSVADLRFGILTAKERWELYANHVVYVHTEDYLQPLYNLPPEEEHLWIDASLLLDDVLIGEIYLLEPGHAISDDKGLIAGRKAIPFSDFHSIKFASTFEHNHVVPTVKRIKHPWQLMLWNDWKLRNDYAVVVQNRTSAPIPASVNTISTEHIFIEEGAKLQFCTLNASTGPIYIGKNAEVMEGSVIRGPFAMGENAVLKMSSRVYGATTLGPSCVGGGEIKNSILMGYSNKAHDGYLGDAVVGEWCNFGAGSSNSNLKNTAGDVKIWSMHQKQYLSAGQKCGVIMGDYSRAAINSSINTGSVIGVSSNVFGAGLLPTIIDNFRWGVAGTEYEFDKAINDINNWKKLKAHSLSETETSILKYIFEL